MTLSLLFDLIRFVVVDFELMMKLMMMNLNFVVVDEPFVKLFEDFVPKRVHLSELEISFFFFFFLPFARNFS